MSMFLVLSSQKPKCQLRFNSYQNLVFTCLHVDSFVERALIQAKSSTRSAQKHVLAREKGLHKTKQNSKYDTVVDIELVK